MKYPMFDPLLDAVLVMGPLKEIYYCNDACVSLFDIPRKKIISGTPIYELLTVDDESLFITKEGTNGEKKETGYIEVAFDTKGGKKGLVQISILPTQELFGRNKLWFVYFHDVSLEERLHRKYIKQLQEKEKMISELKSLQEGKPVARSESLLLQLKEFSDALSNVSENLDAGLKHGEIETHQIENTIKTLRTCVKKMQEITT